VAFDAGTIDARLTIDPDAFDRTLAKAKADVEKFERDGHKVKISAVFDTGSVGRARKMFADLDNSISRDAMNRLKSSPQGSVLGSLNALFSPHPVTGAPSPSQSAEGGLLGKMLNPQTSGGGGGYSNGGGSPLGSALAQTADITDNVRQNLTGAQPGNITTTDDIKQALVGQGATNTTTTDDIKQALVGQGAKNTTTTDKIMQQMVGSGPGNTSTTDTIREKLDPKSTGDVEKAAEDSGGRAGGQWTVGFGAHLGPFFASFHKRMGDEGDKDGAAMGSGLLGGIGPGILGIGMMMASKIGLIGSALGALPALAGLIGVGMGVAMIGGLLAEAVKGNAKLKAQFTALGGDFTSVISKAVAPVVPVISKAIASLVPIIKSIQGPLTGIFKAVAPQLQGIFAGLKPVITGLLGVMQAAAPAFGPFIMALEKLAGGIFPGIAAVVKATIPFIRQFAGILGGLGGSLGSLFATAAPAIGASMKILGGLLSLIGSLLPVIMKLADIFAVSLAPVFTAFAGVVKTLIGPLVIIGGVIAQFAGAVIGDLAGAFGAVATLITAIGPSLGVLAKAFGSLFTVLENAGVFALIGDALENLAPALGKLIALLITDLAPILPMIVGLFSQLLTITVDLATSGLGFLIRVLTDLVTALPVGLVQALVGGFIALKLVMMGFEGVGMIFAGVSAAVTALGAALDFDTIALKAMYAWDVLVTVATKAWEMAQIVLDAVLNLSPLGLIVIAVAAIGVAIYELVDHWTTVWGAIQSVASTVGDFLDNLFHNGIVQDILAIWSLGLIPLAEHWSAVWGGIEKVAGDAAAFFARTWGDIETAAKTAWNAISAFFTGWWNGQVAAFEKAVGMIRTALSAAWGDVTSALKTAWNAISAFFTSWWAGQVALVARAIGTIKAALSAAWNAVEGTVTTAWDDIKSAISTALGDIIGWLRAWPGKAVSALSSLGGDLSFLGKAVFADLLGGIKSGATSIVSWLQGFAHDVVNVFKTIWGWFSPSTVMYAGGKSLMDGLAAGVKDHAHKALAQVTSVAGKVTAGVAQWRGMVLQALKMEGLSASLAGNVLYQMQTECVTIDTVILTKRGWLDYTEVRAGDETIGYNPDTERNEWTRIERVMHYPQREVWRFGNKFWSVKCTPNHRWLTEHVVRRPAGQQPLGACPECGATEGRRGPFSSQRAMQIHRAREHGVAGDRHGTATAEVITGTALLPLRDVGLQDRIVLARETDTGTALDVTVNEAALLAWIAGDGWVSGRKDYWRDRKPEPARKPPGESAPFGYRRDGQPRKDAASGRPLATGPAHKMTPPRIGICQAKSEHFAAIDKACADDPAFTRSPARPGAKPHHKPIVDWRLSSEYASDLLARAGNPKTDAVGQVLRMSAEQRDAWLGAMIAAEGSHTPGKTVVYQNDGPVADAIELAIYLSGQRPARSKAHSGWAIGITAPHVGGPSRRGFREPAGHEDVWCVTTTLGTWTARQEGHVFLTGNSGGNAAAINLSDINAQQGDPSRGLMQVIGTTFSEYHWPGTSNNIYDPLANIAAALNYAKNVYGPTLMSGGMGIGSGHGYALGGPINEMIIGYGVNSGRRYTFGENGPEYVTPGGSPPGGGSDPALLARMDALIAATRGIPAGVGSSVGGAIGGAASAASFRSRYPRGGS
jgi:phage-related protein